MRRPVLVFVFLVVLVSPAAAHTFIDPPVAAPGSITTVTLNAADERDSAAISSVELYLPEGAAVPIVEARAGTPGWTGTVFADRVEFPAAGPEPDMPGLVLDLVPGAAGEVPPTPTVPPAEAPTASATASATESTTTSTVGSSEPVPFTSEQDDGGGSDAPLVIGLVVAVVVGIAAFLVWRRRA